MVALAIVTLSAVTVCGHSVRLADLSEKIIEPPTTSGSLIYTGAEAQMKLKATGLEPLKDMDLGTQKS